MFFCHRGSDSPPNCVFSPSKPTLWVQWSKSWHEPADHFEAPKVLRDADVVSRDRGGAASPLPLNPDVFATVTEWINETVQVARQSSEAHVPVALPGGATAPAENKAADKAPEKVAVKTAEVAEKPEVAASEKPAEKVVAEKTAAEKPSPLRPRRRLRSPLLSRRPASETPIVEAPSAEEIEQARIQRARAQYLTPSARIYHARRSRLLKAPPPNRLSRRALLSPLRRKRQWTAPRCALHPASYTVTMLG